MVKLSKARPEHMPAQRSGFTPPPGMRSDRAGIGPTFRLLEVIVHDAERLRADSAGVLWPR